MEKKPKVFVGLPTMGSVHIELFSWAMNIHKTIKDIAEPVLFHASVGVTPVEHARNEIVRTFLMSDCTHLLMVDADTIPPVDALRRLLLADKDVVTGLTPIAKMTGGESHVVDNAFLDIEHTPDGGLRMNVPERNTGLHKLVRAGASCLLIKREVLEKLGNPWFMVKWNEDFTGYISEDINFCDRVIAAGFEIWADTDVVCRHSKTVML